MPKERKKSLCMDTLRHAEYYGMLQTFDDLYANAIRSSLVSKSGCFAKVKNMLLGLISVTKSCN